ncbi:MAG TPA: hypothetical protein VK811_01255, partial [Candidatus Acidoferrum sp.]|nr:hypothetical protein [Candidatus Acidoferrum sp.]
MNTSTMTAEPLTTISPGPAIRPGMENGHAGRERSTVPVVTPKLPRPFTRKQMVLGLVALTAIISFTALAYQWWTVGRFIESTDDAYLGGDVTVIAPEVAGFINELAVTDNQRVHAG